MGYYAEVERSLVEKGPGVFRLYLDGKLLREWDCITGGDQLDSREYGGLCPEIEWVMTDKIDWHEHPAPSRGKEFMAIIVPRSGGKTFFPKRTLQGEDSFPFMLHIAGSSTGCIAIQADQWDDFVSCVNSAFEAESFGIRVFNREVLISP